MQYEQAQRIGDTRVGFLDPLFIKQASHDWPLKLKDDSRDLAVGKTKE